MPTEKSDTFKAPTAFALDQKVSSRPRSSSQPFTKVQGSTSSKQLARLRQLALCLGVAAALAVAAPVFAQSGSDVLRGLQGALDLLGAPQQNRGGSGISRPDLNRGGPTEQPVMPTPGVIPSRQVLLDLTRQGKLANLHRSSADDARQFRASIYAIVVNEYQVPPFGMSCMNAFDRDVVGLFNNQTRYWSSILTNEPPQFVTANISPDAQRARAEVRETMANWERQRTSCDGSVMGRVVPNPYKAALADLADQFGKAMTAYAEEERGRRVDAYAAQVAQAQDAAAREQEHALRQQAAQQAIAQQRINAEAARIRAEEQRRERVERSRVGG